MTGNNPAPSPTELSVVKVLRPVQGIRVRLFEDGPSAVNRFWFLPNCVFRFDKSNPVTPLGKPIPFAYDEQARQGVAGLRPSFDKRWFLFQSARRC